MLNHESSNVEGETERADTGEQPPEGGSSDRLEAAGEDPEPAPSSESDDVPSSIPRSISKDDLFHLLQNSRRRAVLRYLLEQPDTEQFRMRDVAEAVAAWENDTTLQQLTSDQRQRVYIALYQSHLPKLDEQGIIEYNQARGVVEPLPLLVVCERFLEDGLDIDAQTLTVDEGVHEEDGSAAVAPGSGLGNVLSGLFSR